MVVVSEWEQACCGTGFRVGDAATWDLSAADPTLTPIGSLPRFIEEHHDQTAEEVPHWSVTGTVRAITGVIYPQLPVTGEPRSFVPDTDHPSLTKLSAVEAATSTDFFEYLVEFDVADDCALPGFVVSDWEREQRQAAVQETARNHARMEDPVGAVLEAAADYAETTFGAVASIVRDPDRSAITIEPHRVGATAVRWARSVHNADGIGIHTGDGSWWLPATVEDAGLARVFLEAAAFGRVTEEVVDREGEFSAEFHGHAHRGTVGEHSSPDPVSCLQDNHGPARLMNGLRGGKTRGPRTDHDHLRLHDGDRGHDRPPARSVAARARASARASSRKAVTCAVGSVTSSARVL